MNLIARIFGRPVHLNMDKQMGPASEDDIKQALESIDAIIATMSETDNWRVVFSSNAIVYRRSSKLLRYEHGQRFVGVYARRLR